ncbi:MAG: TIGR03747 family integrating conjugative element membrane protein [Gammaproteobacteria bacterium]|nr:TIGR03747 family integrating conjugative element membrane protein [Gammaproteobacteria bacterium]
MKERREPSRNLVARIVRGITGWLFALAGALFLSVVIEWAGLTFLWPDQGSARSAHVLERDLAYLGVERGQPAADPGSAPALAAVIFGRLYRGVMVDTGLEAVLRGLSGFSSLVADYLEACLNTVQTFLVRVAITLTALPILVLFALWGALEGMVRRDLRRFGGDIERGMVYHWLKHFAGALVIMPVVLYLAWPGAVNPAWVFIPFALALAVNVMAITATFTKYV